MIHKVKGCSWKSFCIFDNTGMGKAGIKNRSYEY